MTQSEKSIVVCPGSYDPITNGHLDVIRRAANLYDEVVVAVVNRSVRKDKALFGIDERMALHRALDRRPRQGARGAVLDARRRVREGVGAKAIVKGLRAISDFEYELEMNQLNRRQDPQIESVYLMAKPAVQFSILERRQGARDVRWQNRRPRPPEVAVRLQEELRR